MGKRPRTTLPILKEQLIPYLDEFQELHEQYKQRQKKTMIDTIVLTLYHLFLTIRKFELHQVQALHQAGSQHMQVLLDHTLLTLHRER